MTVLNRILLSIYYLLWIITLCFAYAFLTDRFYAIGRLFGPVIGIVTVLVSTITLMTLILLYCFRKSKRQRNGKIIKLIILPALALIPFFIINAIPEQLDETTHKIRVRYIAYGCECANWKVLSDNGTKCKDNQCEDIFLEPLNEKVILPDTIGVNGDIIELTGNFYSKKGFPKGYYSEQLPEKARVFQYAGYKVIKSNYDDLKEVFDE